MQLIQTFPNTADYHLFEEVPKSLYSEQSPRWILGHDPIETYLTGCYVLYDQGKAVGRFAFYENPKLTYLDQKAACIGSYECIDSNDVAHQLLTEAQNIAKKHGYSWLIGPMEGSTWENHRFSQYNDHRNYFMEPYHHTYYNHHFTDFGFQKISSYYTSIGKPVDFGTEKLNAFEEKIKSYGATFRPINMDSLKEDLAKIGAFSNEAFHTNFLFSPIEVQHFVSKYAEVGQYFDPTLIWMVEDANKNMLALVFAIKDHTDPAGEHLIIKTLARKNDPNYRGIGSFLMAKINQIAIERGYPKVIYAMVRDDGYSEEAVAKHQVKKYKFYNLYGLQL